MHSQFVRRAVFAFFTFAMMLPASASPWAEVGDSQLRADIEVLQAADMVEVITMAWPLPWQSLLKDLSHADLARQPASVQAAAQRVLARAQGALSSGVSAWANVDVTNTPSVIYGFDGRGRGE